MNIDNELTEELMKLHQEEFVIKQELENHKKRFIDDLNNGLGEEIRNIKELNRPIKLRKPFKMKIREFFDRISKVLGN